MLQNLGILKNDTALFDEAIAAYRAASAVYRSAINDNNNQRVRFSWARTQYNIGRLLLILGEFTKNRSRLEQAMAAYDAALAAFSPTTAGYYIEVCQQGKNRVDILLKTGLSD